MKIDRPIAIALIFLVTLVLIFILVLPKYNEFKASQASLGKIEAEFNGKYKYYAKVAKAYRDLKVNQESIDKVDNALPEKPSISNTIYFFQKKASESGLIVKSLYLTKFSSTKSEGSLKDITFSISLMGSYSALKNFVSALESSARLFETESISFGSLTSTTSAITATEQKTSSKTKTSAQIQIEPIYTFTLEVKTHSY